MKFNVLKPGEAPPAQGRYLFAHQAEFIRAVDDLVMAVMGRGAGKSQMAATAATIHLKNGASGMLIGPTFEDCDVILTYMVELLDESKTAYQWHKSKHYIKLKRNGAIMYYRTAETEKGIRGKTNLNFLIMDEAALSSREIYLVALACLRGSKGPRWRRVYLISTPKGRGNWLYDEAMKPGTRLIRGSTRDNTSLGESFYNTLRDNYSAEFLAQEAEAEWIDLTACNVYEDHEFDVMTRYMCGVGQVVVGVDVAVGGDNSSVCVMRGNEIIRVMSRKTTTDIDSLITLVRDALGGLAPDYIVVDATGVGAFAPKELKKTWQGAAVIPVNFGDKAWKPGFENRRTEIHFDLKARLKNASVCFGPSVPDETRRTLLKQMRATEYTIAAKSAYKLIPKKDIKAKIGTSPDELDSLALACSVDIVAMARVARNSAPNLVMPITARRN